MADVVSFRKEEPANPVRVERFEPILRITLNNPPANALSVAVMEALGAALDAAAADEAIRIVILASTGKVFSAGHDLKEMTARRGDPDGGRAFFEKTMRMAADLMLKIAALPQPVVAEIDGLATAAGCQLVASCDLAICTDTSTFCTPGVNIGLFCSTPMVAVTRAAHPKQAMEMLLTGETIDASTAKDFGLVNRIVPQQYLRQVVDKYAAVIASKSPQALRIGKAAMRAQAGLPLPDAYDVAVATMVDNMFADDAKEGIGAFLDKRMPEWGRD
ncbi:enoyl-CoA hydratase [Shinella sp. CPCC 100929]|uniref:Enoyl-CoA hydratase domain-containing protein 3, mitochondrial n=1 Tax=Shinella lacus TaxID=2654216 RepID=A0ABT1RAW0_9HYPH|nr:enoyl-CoA hydratase [Shinella lacus]MCQ4632300.1 enoyl-CoA hydratase [Shinella lacus]